MNKNQENWNKIYNTANDILKGNYYYSLREWQYKNIRPKLIIEKLLLDEKGRIPFDYKFFCFNGKCKFIQVDTNRFSNHQRNFYDRNWKQMPFNLIYPSGESVECPENLNKMLSIVEVLSECFIFARVDLYNVKNKIYFGEITFHPEGGFGKFYPEEWDKKLGELLQLPIDVS